MITIVIPLYNKALSVKKTLESVLNQSFKDFEILVVNDGSTDNSVSVVKSIADHRIRIVDKQNGGVSSARNLGIREAKYNWIAFLDADDNWKSNHLQNIVNVIENKTTEGFIATAFIQTKKSLEDYNVFSAQKEGLQNYFDVASINGFPVHSSAVCINKEILKKIQFKVNLTLGEDNELFARIGREHLVYFICEPTSYYILEAENKATQKEHPIINDYLYQIDFERGDISNNERKYYVILIFYHLYKFLKQEKNLTKFYRLFFLYKKKLKLSDFLIIFNHLSRK